MEDLTALAFVSTKLMKKAAIATTKWLVWDATHSHFVGFNVVRFPWFSADNLGHFSDLRIQEKGNLVQLSCRHR